MPSSTSMATSPSHTERSLSASASPAGGDEGWKRVADDESKAAAMRGYTATMLPLLYDNANSAEEG